MSWASMVAVGVVARPHGNRGAVVVAPETDFAEQRFSPGQVVHVRGTSGERTLTVAAGRAQGARWVVSFEGFASIDDAETLRGLELRVPADSLSSLEPGRFYVHDLLECDVRTLAGESVGRVTRVDLAGGPPMLAVTSTRGEEILVPFVDTICRRVDITGKRIEIDPPEGLIELNRAAPRGGRAGGQEGGAR